MWKRKKRKSQQMKYDQTKHARMNLEKKKSLLTIMKNFKNRIVHGIMLSIVSLGK
jgi:predicted RNA-binding protein Jag